ncbi:2,3-bisphosphoglycerate-independent phosphoglycerate mutase [Halobacteriovorax sp. JY17]|uniref:2,3-bisphosphoglycerate-independent phosphoglycerate mutase n=1 Tax=Halobacteriovorax sp. JY17 TaxID=2014617 RepID=UPI000C6A417C|nr:2,3-bisphosphoglycerate-independent phosphoglycerate mutase [Halobacteriovorax sp. JY17]PIK13948.1 MAG: phosphoglycerate mutase (2,3-diphosphoglycerate-independent) [Halobacteriovorax sp. JY17]
MKSIKKLSDRALLVILDGYGLSESDNKNAVLHANTPNLDLLFKHYPFTKIEAGGEKVGLPKGVIGNSEVGHMNLGAGRPVRQDLVRINESIENHTFNTLPKLIELKESARKASKRIHIMGLLSDGGVHSHIDHIKETIKALTSDGDLEVFFHAFMDGRDTAQDVGHKYVEEMSKVSNCTFASMQGRSIGMDRDRRWEKIKLAYDTFTGQGSISKTSPMDYLKSEYEKGIYDEFITPTLFGETSAMKEGDSLFFINFRPDRAIQLALAFNDPKFSEFKRDFTPNYFLCMTPYIPDEVELPILFNKERLSGVMSEYVSSLGIKQFKIAETEKYAHVTFFFNGGKKEPFENEEHFLIPSPKEVSTYDQKPEMSAYLVTDKLIDKLEDKETKFFLVNFANSDMVGHTGKFDAAVKAVEALDLCVARLMKKCEEENIALLLTADHGNSDQMIYEDGSPHTSHTNSLVPFSVFHKELKDCEFQVSSGEHALMDVSPTVLNILDIECPDSFTGKSIFK